MSGEKPKAVRGERFLQLDTLRFIFALYIVPGHMVAWTGPLVNASLAVDFFFILSGFVLSQALITRPVSHGEFAVIRFARLWPLNAITALVVLALMPPQRDWLNATASFLLLQNTGLLPGNLLNHPSWSISAEFVVGLTLLYVLARYRVTIVALGLVCLLPAVMVQFSAATGIPVDQQTGQHFGYFAIGLVRCALGTAIGYLVYEAYRHLHPRLPNGWILGVLQTALFAAILIMIGTPGGDGFQLAAIGVAAMLVLFGASGPSFFVSTLGSKAISWVGDLSFGIYMWHYPLLVVFFQQHWLPSVRGHMPVELVSSNLPMIGVFYLVLLTLAFASYHLVEYPLKRRIPAMLGVQASRKPEPETAP